MLYAGFIGSNIDPDSDVALRLERLRRLKVTVAYPFLLRVFYAFQGGALRRDDLLKSLDILEAFLIRRSICNMPTNQLRRMLPPVFDAAGGAGSGFIDGLCMQLGGKRCPDDAAFVAALVKEPLYSTAEKNARLRLILERLERLFEHKEPAELSGAQIEHVLPQTLTPEWEAELGDNPEEQWAQLVHTLGNLTLTKYNSELSNKPYEVKRKELQGSHFVLNHYFAQVPRWTPDAIRERARDLATRAVKIWGAVGVASKSTERPLRLAPVKVRFRGTEQGVLNWKDAFVKLLTQFDACAPGLLLRIASDHAVAFIATNADRFPRSKARIGEIYINTHASAAQLQEWCRKVAEIGNIGLSDYEFIMPADPSAGSTVS